MGVNQRKRRSRRELRESSESKRESEDRISSLPDEVLGRVLSLLPTKYAVATTVLSSKWKNLYKLSTTLDFDDSLSFNTGNDSGNEGKEASFKKFVNEMLVRCKMSQITKFRLKCGHYSYKNCYLLYDWIDTAASFLKAVELELSIDITSRVVWELKLPQSTCENLVVLKLDCRFTLCVLNTVTFPRLKVLYLKGITFGGNGSTHCNPSSGDHGLNGLLSCCPLLEELLIQGCDWSGGDLIFTNPLLTRLTLQLGTDGLSDQLNCSTVYFNLPSLVYLNYSECLADQYEIRDLKSVIEANINVCFNDDEFEDQQDLCDAVLDLIIGIHRCQSLNLSLQCLEALTSGDCDFQLPIFCNLARLSLALGRDVSWNDVLLDFLNSSPSLESLTLELEQGFLSCNYILQDEELLPDGEADDEFLLNDEEVPTCVHYRLKFINIKDFRGFPGEMQMIMYFLENAHLLMEMVIHWHQGIRKRDSIFKEEEIMKLPKSSKSCSITFE